LKFRAKKKHTLFLSYKYVSRNVFNFGREGDIVILTFWVLKKFKKI